MSVSSLNQNKYFSKAIILFLYVYFYFSDALNFFIFINRSPYI